MHNARRTTFTALSMCPGIDVKNIPKDDKIVARCLMENSLMHLHDTVRRWPNSRLHSVV
jgi:hypothetical protein